MAVITDFGVTSEGIQQPLLKNRWRITFINFAGDPSPLTTQAISADRPKVELAEVELHRYNGISYVPAKYMYQPMTIMFDTDVGGTLHTSIVQQFELQQALLGNFPAPLLPAAIGGAVFKFGIKLEHLDGGTRTLETWNYEGCFIQNLDFGDVDYAVSEKVTTTMVIRYDIARLAVSGVATKATGGAIV